MIVSYTQSINRITHERYVNTIKDLNNKSTCNLKTPEQYLKDSGWQDFKLNQNSFRDIAINAIKSVIVDFNKNEDANEI